MTNNKFFAKKKCTKEYLTQKLCVDVLDLYRDLKEAIFKGKTGGTVEMSVVDLGRVLDNLIDEFTEKDI
jgi:hypothetical protein